MNISLIKVFTVESDPIEKESLQGVGIEAHCSGSARNKDTFGKTECKEDPKP